MILEIAKIAGAQTTALPNSPELKDKILADLTNLYRSAMAYPIQKDSLRSAITLIISASGCLRVLPAS